MREILRFPNLACVCLIQSVASIGMFKFSLQDDYNLGLGYTERVQRADPLNAMRCFSAASLHRNGLLFANRKGSVLIKEKEGNICRKRGACGTEKP